VTQRHIGSPPKYKDSLAGFNFKTGNTYAEFRQGDKLAGYGLTALVAGGAAAVAVKTGLFKYIGKFLIFILAGIAAFFKKIWAIIKRIAKQRIEHINGIMFDIYLIIFLIWLLYLIECIVWGTKEVPYFRSLLGISGG